MATKGFSGGAKARAYLEALARRVSSATEVDVGFLAGSTYPNGTSVPTVAAIQEFGAPEQGIPSRPFFRNMIAQHQGEWPKETAAVLKAADYDATLALGRMGERVAGELRQSIVDTNTPPLAPATIARKGSAKPLVDTGVMLQSVDHKVK